MLCRGIYPYCVRHRKPALDHSWITHSRKRTVPRGHRRTRRLRHLSSGGSQRSRQDTRGHGADTVRDREAPGSNPGPPTNFEFKIADFGRHPQWTGHSRGTDSLETRNEAAKLSRWAADLNLDDMDLVRAYSYISGDATVRTVRHPVRKSQAGAPEDAQGRTVRHPV
jgi:hypothetical protein